MFIIKWFAWFARRWQPLKDVKNDGSLQVRAPKINALQVNGSGSQIIDPAGISLNALKVLNRLSKSGYSAYLVGGSVRDLLLKRRPKDFDVATNATPEEVHRLFRNGRLIGRRFRIVHVHFGRDIIEVVTFRAAEGYHPDSKRQIKDGLVLRDNVYGTLEEDAFRRDFTINALYYHVKTAKLVDDTGGLADLKKGLIRTIGDPSQRFREDPVRILRALRFAAKLGFALEEKTASAIHLSLEGLKSVSKERLFDELMKLFYHDQAWKAYELAEAYGLLAVLLKPLSDDLVQAPSASKLALLKLYFSELGNHVSDDQTRRSTFLWTVLLWLPLEARVNALVKAEALNRFLALDRAYSEVLREQREMIALPKWLSLTIREIMTLQYRLTQAKAQRPEKLLQEAGFPMAYHLLRLRAQSDPTAKSLAARVRWWAKFQQNPCLDPPLEGA